ncbi:MAG: hypothetical protein IPK55_15140 [Streptococcus sp.]|nr:hypothetical protein [Streptococcus sp.]
MSISFPTAPLIGEEGKNQKPLKPKKSISKKLTMEDKKFELMADLEESDVEESGLSKQAQAVIRG